MVERPVAVLVWWVMTTPGPDRLLEALRTESARFRAALSEAPVAAVPSCPDWDTDDLLWHLAEVQWFWATIVAQRPAAPDDVVHPERPADRGALLAFFDEHSARLAAGLAGASPSEPCWSWAEEQTVGFTYRRQAHEALVHRVDAELTSGLAITSPDADLAADGVAEVLGVMYGGTPDWGTLTDERRVLVRCADTGDAFAVQIGRFTGTSPDGTDYDEAALDLVSALGTDAGVAPVAEIAGPAAALDLWMWDRADDAALTRTGDEAALAAFEGIIRQPIT